MRVVTCIDDLRDLAKKRVARVERRSTSMPTRCRSHSDSRSSRFARSVASL